MSAREKRILPPTTAHEAYVHTIDAGEHLSVTLARIRGGAVAVPEGVEAKLVEAQQAVFAAQRLMESALPKG